MPVTWTISDAERLVQAVATGTVTLQDIERYLDAVTLAGALGYRKIFDASQGRMTLGAEEIRALGARIRAYDRVGPLGPLALVAGTPEGLEQIRLFTALSRADRPLRIFSDTPTARRWLDSRAADQ